MKIGTWNLAGSWTEAHHAFLDTLDCDLYLLTEVSERLALPGYFVHSTNASMAPKRRWAAVASRSALVPLPDPHPATAFCQVGEWTVASSILPWRSAPRRSPWTDAPHAHKTRVALEELEPALARSGERLIWGGDWNHALHGPEGSGSMKGRERLLATLGTLKLSVPTADLPHRIDGRLAIDHVAVPSAMRALSAERYVAAAQGKRLSDHDAYVVSIGQT